MGRWRGRSATADDEWRISLCLLCWDIADDDPEASRWSPMVV